MLGFHRWLCCLAFTLLFAACGSKNDTGGQSNTPAPQIVTTSVKEALKGELYSQPLAATGGSAPLVWSLPTEPKEIPWLSIDSSSGALSGTPTESLVPAKSFVVQVKDHDGRSDQKTFTLTVVECTAQKEGATFTCHVPSDNACIAGTRLCSGGQLGECIVGNGSASTDYCGPDCLACGSSANVCTGGRCFCGTEEPCGTTERPDCCYESYSTVCTNRQTDPKHCGDCDNECDKDTKNVVPTCVGGTCITPAPCRWGYARCPLGSNEPDCSTNTATDLLNCGACDNRCPSQNDLATNHATPSCQNGQCKITCWDDGAEDCNGQLNDGCECYPKPIDGAMLCTTAGACSPQCPPGKDSLCKVPEVNFGLLACYSSNEYVQCTPGDSTSCVPNGTETKDGDGRIIRVDNCGRCGNTCLAPSGSGGKVSCDHSSGACTQSCDQIEPFGFLRRALCSGQCVSLAMDRNNCGACGSVCPATIPNGTAACLLGTCTPSCGTTPVQVCYHNEGEPSVCETVDVQTGNCDGSLASGCECLLNSNTNCGACGQACSGNDQCTDTCTSWRGSESTTCLSWAWQCVDPNSDGGG